MARVRDIMVAPVVTVRAETPLVDVLQQMVKGSFSGIPVVRDGGDVEGFITAFDVLQAVEGGRDLAATAACEVMAPGPETADEDDTIQEAIKAIVRARGSVPVTRGGRLTGIISRSDAMRGLFEGNAEAEELSFIPETVKALIAARSYDEVLRMLINRMGRYFEANRCSVVSVEEQKGVATVLSTYEDADLRNLEIKLSRYPEIIEAYRTRRPVILTDAVNDPLMESVRQYIENIDLKSVLVFPIISDDKVLGTLYLRTQTRSQFSGREIRVAEILAALTADALKAIQRETKLRKLYKDAEKKVVLDDLTGLYNRRFFTIRLAEEFNMSVRHGLPISCIMFDIDYFKRINDTLGHEEGDKVLMKFADCLKRSVRMSDIVARYAGDEFFLLLPMTDEKGAVKEAERIKGLLDQTEGGPSSDGLTVSVGVVGFPCRGVRKPEDMIRNADRAMYEAKKAGRNRIILFSAGPTEGG
jgi:diguanylate cyclase (GGDEF)-like protein